MMVSTPRRNHIDMLLNFTNRTKRPVIQPPLDPEEATGCGVSWCQHIFSPRNLRNCMGYQVQRTP